MGKGVGIDYAYAKIRGKMNTLQFFLLATSVIEQTRLQNRTRGGQR